MKYIQIKWFALVLLLGIMTGGLLQFTRVILPTAPRTSAQTQVPRPFLRYPYYGSASFQSRINSYFDHDKPWYANDGTFVRYDGKRWDGSNTSVMDCQPGASCYDGHNGYDLHMRFEPVLSAASGTVINAGWYNPQNHNDSFGLWVAINHGNGFANVYGHLSALTVSVGQYVGTQWQIGTGGTTGSSTGPHLHFGTYYYPSWQATDPSGWTGKYADPNTVRDYNLWDTASTATPVPLLAAHGKKLAPGAILVDDNAPDWKATGSWSGLKAKSALGGSLHWASTTSGRATATATWQAVIPSDGYYEIGAFVDDTHASSSWASYTIYSSDPRHPERQVHHRVEVDEEHVGLFQSSFGTVNTGAQWIGLGTYYFKGGQPGRVVLDNATGENGQQIAADGIEFAPLVPPVYAFTLADDTTPARMTSGSSVTINLTLTNTGNFSWPVEGAHAVQLIYRWIDSQGHALSTSPPIALAQDLAVHAATRCAINVTAPAQAGAYTLQWDLLQDGQSFSQAGAQPKNDSVTVVSASGSGPTKSG